MGLWVEGLLWDETLELEVRLFVRGEGSEVHGTICSSMRGKVSGPLAPPAKRNEGAFCCWSGVGIFAVVARPSLPEAGFLGLASSPVSVAPFVLVPHLSSVHAAKEKNKTTKRLGKTRDSKADGIGHVSVYCSTWFSK